MESSVVTIASSVAVGIVTILIAWFKFARMSKATEVRLILLEDNYGKTVSRDHFDEHSQHTQERIDSFEGRVRSDVATVVESLEKITADCCDNDREIIRLQEFVKSLELFKGKMLEIEALRSEFLEKFMRRSDFIREIQILDSQLKVLYPKIERLEQKIDERFRK